MPKDFITFWKMKTLYIFSVSIFASHSKLANFFFIFSNLANRKGTTLFGSLMSVEAEISWSLVIRNWCRSCQRCDLSSYRWVLAAAWTPALGSWSCLSPPASDVPPGFWTQSPAIWPPCPRPYPKQHQGLSLIGTHILISSKVSLWMFTAGGVSKMLSREVFAVFCFRVTCVLFKSQRNKLQLRSCFPWISEKVR